jgi:shikimate 5-dehydrogenase
MSLVVTLPPAATPAHALSFARDVKARGATFLELRTDVHSDIDVAALAACIDVLVAERGTPLAASWIASATLVDRPVGAHGASVLSFHAEQPLSPADALAIWARHPPPSRNAHIKHVEPLGALREVGRLLETRALLETRFGAGRVTVLPWGPLALPMRAVLAAANALDYVAASPSWQAIPGQRLLDDAARIARAPRAHESDTARLGILGTGIGGSRSPRIHAPPFDRIDVPADAAIDELLPALHRHYRGFAVTSPFKKAAARACGSDLRALNTLVRRRRGWQGFDTDVFGARAILGAIRSPRVVVLGDGGAASALRVAAAELGVHAAVKTQHDVSVIEDDAVWTWPVAVPVPAALAFAPRTRVAIIAYGAPALQLATRVRSLGGTPVLLGPRWFIAQARRQRELWQEAL